MYAALRIGLLTGLFLAMLVRAAMPSGWMPIATSSGFSVVLCSTTGATPVQFDPGHPAEVAPEPCPYALVAAGPAPAQPFAFPLAISLPFLFATLPLLGVRLLDTWARPPPTAPPFTLSA